MLLATLQQEEPVYILSVDKFGSCGLVIVLLAYFVTKSMSMAEKVSAICTICSLH